MAGRYDEDWRGWPRHRDDDRFRGRGRPGREGDDVYHYGADEMERYRPERGERPRGWRSSADRAPVGMYGGIFGHMPGTMAGKGPKGYRRSDERIKEDVCDRLTDDHELDASSIEVEIEKGEITLAGSVDSRAAKRHAEALVESVSGVKDVHNNLKVHPQGDESGGGTGKSVARRAGRNFT